MGDYTTQLYVRIMIRQHARSGLKLPPFFHRKRGMVLTVKAVTTVTLGIGSTTFRKRCRRQGSEWKIFWPIHGHLSCSRLIKHWAGCKLQTWLFLEIRLVFCVSNDTLLMTHRLWQNICTHWRTATTITAGRRAGRQYWWWWYNAGIWLPCFWRIGSYFKISMLEEALPF